MKLFINKIKDFYNKGNNPLYFSLVGPLFMGIIHLISLLIQFDWIVTNYCIFSFLMAIFIFIEWLIEKRNSGSHYVVGIIAFLVVLAPMMAAFVLTILFRDAPIYIFNWFVYAYALFGTIKMVLSIRKLSRKDKTKREYTLSLLGLLSALYTIQMMEFRLIMFASNGQVDESMYLMQLFTQGAIFIYSIVAMILLLIKQIKASKNMVK